MVTANSEVWPANWVDDWRSQGSHMNVSGDHKFTLNASPPLDLNGLDLFTISSSVMNEATGAN